MKKLISTILALLVFVPSVALASITDTIEGEVDLTYDITIRLDVSKDNGATWHNYDAEENPGEETLTINGGDELLFKIQLWNSGNAPVANIIIENTVSQPDYLIFNNTFVDSDEDKNLINCFAGDPFGNIFLPFVLMPVEDLELGYESATFSAKVKEDVPASAEISFVYEVNSEELYFGGRIDFAGQDIFAQNPTGTAISEVRTITPEPEILGAIDGPTVLAATGGSNNTATSLWIFLVSFLGSYFLLDLKKKAE